MNITKVEAYKASDGTVYLTQEQAQKRELFLFINRSDSFIEPYKGHDFLWENRAEIIDLLSSHPELVDVDSSGDCDFRGEAEPVENIAKTQDFPPFRTLG